MSDEQISIDLDPKKVIKSLKDMSKEMQDLAEKCEKAFGKDAKESIEKFEDAAEKGSNKIATYFRNLGKRIKEDLKAAFDASKIISGANLGKDLIQGTKQIFEMERAFDRLNTRLKLTTKQLQEFKKDVGRSSAAAGQSVQDILPGIETAAGKGGVKNQGQLAAIGDILAKSRAITGEATQGLSEDIIDIIHNQGQKVNAQNFKQTMDAVQATRVGGAFNNAADAAAAIKEITHGLTPAQQKQMGIGSREAGGLAAVAGQSEGGIGVLSKLLSTGQTAGGQQLINSILGSQVFKGGKINQEGLSNINKKNLGQFSPQVMSEALGVDQAELARFIDSMHNNMDKLGVVTSGANETSDQFATATDNLAFKIDKFKKGIQESGAEIGESLSNFTKDILTGNFKNMGTDLKSIGVTAMENKGGLAAAGGTALLSAVLLGGGLKSILKIPGAGGLAGGLAGGEMAKAAGVTPVYVVNASEIGAGAGGLFNKVGGAVAAAGGTGALATGALVTGGAVVAAGVMYESKKFWDKALGGGALTPSEINAAPQENPVTPEALSKAVHDGTIAAHEKIKSNEKVQFTNKSAVSGTGGKM